MLQKALELNPRLGSAHYFAGLALKADGNYPAAFEEFSKASSLYPRDRVVRNQMGRMLFLQREYREAVGEFEKTLTVDPEDLEAHYNLMLCHRGLRDDARAAREEKLYLRFKADESSRAITGPYKLTHPEDNNEAQPIHEHVSVALGKAVGSGQYAGGRIQESEVRSQKLEIRKQRAGGRSKENHKEVSYSDTDRSGNRRCALAEEHSGLPHFLTAGGQNPPPLQQGGATSR
jgi:tetratricopeptide (TPR) repeat protein